MQTESREAFKALLTRQLSLIGKFQEHIDLIKGMTGDEKMNVFLDHLAEEESEHQEKVRELLEGLEALSEVHKPDVPVQVSASSDREYGHFERRDQNILTVGSLYGARQ